MQMINYDSRQPWEDLANGIVEQAADDYKKALKKIQKNEHFEWKIKAAQEIHSINRWFRSDWFGMLTQIDPEYLIQNLNKFYGSDATTKFVNKHTTYDKERI